jgi:hypothetical protein
MVKLLGFKRLSKSSVAKKDAVNPKVERSRGRSILHFSKNKKLVQEIVIPEMKPEAAPVVAEVKPEPAPTA